LDDMARRLLEWRGLFLPSFTMSKRDLVQGLDSTRGGPGGTSVAGSRRPSLPSFSVSKRDLAHVLDSTGVLEATLQTRMRFNAPRLTVLTYHRVHEDPDAQPFDRDVIDATTAEFDRQVRTLKRYFTIVGLSELQAFLRGAALPSNPAMITFDDGYRDCHDRVLPIMLSHGVRGVFFLATSYVTHRRVFWWDRIAYILNQTTADRIELRYPGDLVLDRTLGTEAARRVAIGIVKKMPGLDVERFLEELACAAGVPWGTEIERAFADELVMTWDHVLRLRRAGMEVHSHTRTHRVLQTITPHEIESELAGARADLEEHLEERVRGIAYPVGRSIARFPALRAAVAACGYDVGFSNSTGVSSLAREFDPLNVRRISVERGLPHSYFRALLAIPGFAESADKG
jgi:peptidoglycan/xylan/chitin deacetylase (PgdA/CDA1 family)